MIDLGSLELSLSKENIAPVEQWNPTVISQIDIKILRDGSWLHEGSEISRLNLVKLFASVLVLEDDRYFLVTPEEKAEIQVEDTPFVVISTQLIGDSWIVTNNLGDQKILNQANPLLPMKSGEPRMLWRKNLTARINQTVMYQWQIYALDHQGLVDQTLWLHSAGQSYAIDSLN